MTKPRPPQDPAALTRCIEAAHRAKHRTRMPGPTLPQGTRPGWTRLHAGVDEFPDDLAARIRPENEVVFPQSETHGAGHV